MIFLTLEEVINDHAKIIRQYGGLPGIRDLGLLMSAIEMPKAGIGRTYLHPTIFDKASAYLFHIVCNHPFIDGNKRSGTTACLSFLKQNGFSIRFNEKASLAFEELVVGVAQGRILKPEITAFLENHFK